MQLSSEQMIELMQYAFTRLDGAWFLGTARKMGVTEAWELDVEAWKQFSYLFGKKLRSTLIPEPVWPESLIAALDILGQMLKIEGRESTVDGNRIIIRVKDCETQKMIVKAGVADCGIATIQTYEGIIRGLFAGAVNAKIEHTKNLNHGDECCEVMVSAAADTIENGI